MSPETGLKRRLLFFCVCGVLGTGIQVNLMCVFFFPKQGGFQVGSTFVFLLNFFPPSFKAVLVQVIRNGHEWTHDLQQTKTAAFFWKEITPQTPRYHDQPRLSTQDLDAWRIGRTEIVGRQEQGLPGKRPNDLLENLKLRLNRPYDPPRKRRKAEAMPAVARSFSMFLSLLLLHFLKELLW